jgi:hypothetical protein
LARQNYKAEKRRRELEKKKKKEAKREKRLHRTDEGEDSVVEGEEVVGTDENADEGAVDQSDSDQSSEENKD